jgi:putative DNA methylase
MCCRARKARGDSRFSSRNLSQMFGAGLLRAETRLARVATRSERAEQLFGEAGREAVARAIEHSGGQDAQFTLFPDQERVPNPPPKARKSGKSRGSQTTAGAAAPREATTLDRVHAAILLQAGGQATGLRAMLEAETRRSPDFLRLANALSALYPKDNEEKRLLDAMLLATPKN